MGACSRSIDLTAGIGRKAEVETVTVAEFCVISLQPECAQENGVGVEFRFTPGKRSRSPFLKFDSASIVGTRRAPR